MEDALVGSIFLGRAGAGDVAVKSFELLSLVRGSPIQLGALPMQIIEGEVIATIATIDECSLGVNRVGPIRFEHTQPVFELRRGMRLPQVGSKIE